jgi:glycosyltransferase involved in cell wall biosynthesis
MHVGQLLQPVPGGIGTYVRELVGSLPAADVELQTFAAGAQPAELAGAYTDLGFPRGALRYESWLRLRRPALPIAVDVVHGPSLAVPPSRIRGRTRAALVVTVHDVAFLRHPEYFTPRGVAFHHRGLDLARNEADIVVTPSSFTREELGREGFDLSRVVAIPHGMHAPSTPAPAAITAALERLGVRTPFVLAVGTVEPRKGLETAAAAVAAVRGTCPDLSLVVAGPTGWNSVGGLDAPHVQRVGAVDSGSLDALFAAAAMCVVPSRYEGFGLPALEAMARGCAVIASSTTSLPEVVGDAGLLVAPDDVDAWTLAITSLLSDAPQLAALQAAGRARAETFTWAGAARSHATAYAQALAHHQTASS